ncbi:MAG: YpsA SLOG family protein, partial [Halochromatium sp.]
MLCKIISGGQTGADRAALDAALEIGFPVGGYCPAGRRAEDGPIPVHYPLEEIDGDEAARTRMNVEAADGTAIFFRGSIKRGTAHTLSCCIALGRAYRLIDTGAVGAERAATALLAFLNTHQVGILNIAGPRLSEEPTIYADVIVICKILYSLRHAARIARSTT